MMTVKHTTEICTMCDSLYPCMDMSSNPRLCNRCIHQLTPEEKQERKRIRKNEAVQRYRERNRLKIKEKDRAHYQRNKEKRKAYQRDYYRKNRAAELKRQAEYRRAKKEKNK